MVERVARTVWEYTRLTAPAMGVTAAALATISAVVHVTRMNYDLSLDTVVFYSLCVCFVLLLAPIPVAYQRGVRLSQQAVFVYRVVLATFAGGIGTALTGTAAFAELKLDPVVRTFSGFALFLVIYWLNPSGFLSSEKAFQRRRS